MDYKLAYRQLLEQYGTLVKSITTEEGRKVANYWALRLRTELTESYHKSIKPLEWCIENEQQIKKMYNETTDRKQTIRAIAHEQWVFDEDKIETLRVKATQLNFFKQV